MLRRPILKRFAADRRGAAAVEFALIAPMMVLTYCGLAEVSLAFLAERRAAHAAAVIADLVAAPAQLTAAQVDDTFRAGDVILRPFPSANLQVRVTSVTANAQGVPKVDWSRARGLTPLAVNTTPAATPAGSMTAGQSLILTDVSYAYTSPLGEFIPDAVTFSETSRATPRKGSVALH